MTTTPPPPPPPPSSPALESKRTASSMEDATPAAVAAAAAEPPAPSPPLPPSTEDPSVLIPFHSQKKNPCTMHDDDEVLNSMRKGQADKLSQVKVEEKQPNQFHQQEGWRVKLYRLNADESWDDCGTGRIFCMYKPKPNKDEYFYSDSGGGRKSSASTAVTTTTTTTAIATNDNDNKFIEDEVYKIKSNNTNENLASSSIPLSNPATIVTETSIFQELGEPTLCMHSQEIICNNADDTDSGSTTNQNLILLRTRILLREPYQRQGENIITWCEPHREEGNTSQGVDLALSFQDNSGCIDIWRQITNVQSKANECFQSKRVNSGSGNNNNSIEGGVLG